MVYLSDLPDNVKHNFRTLHKDIGMVQMSNGSWDLWFDNGDLVSATELHSLQVGIIIACLTSYNWMERYGNPTYTDFGNRAYTLLKANKSSMTRYKVEQFFLECLKRMRRVYDVLDLTVSEKADEPYKYFVEFSVISIDNSIVTGSFTIDEDNTSKSTSYIGFTYNQPYASPYNPLIVDLYLGNEYGGGISGATIFMTVEGHDESIVAGVTDSNGHVQFSYVPKVLDATSKLVFIYGGSSDYNSCVSQELVIQSTPFYFMVDEDDELQLYSSLDDANLLVYIGEFFDDDKANIPSDKTNKLYILEEDGVYNAYTYEQNKVYENVTITGVFDECVGEIHLFISPDEVGLYEYAPSDSSHVYYIGDGEIRF